MGKMEVSTVDCQMLNNAYVAAAKVVAKYGDAYLPIFERLHKEIEASNAKAERKNLARELALSQLPDRL